MSFLITIILKYYKKLDKTKTVGEKIKGLHFINLQNNFDI